MMMKIAYNFSKFLCFCISFMLFSSGYAQIQIGYVKTKGRLENNGTIILGIHIDGATIHTNNNPVAVAECRECVGKVYETCNNYKSTVSFYSEAFDIMYDNWRNNNQDAILLRRLIKK